MLSSVLKEPRFQNKATFSIVLLPPPVISPLSIPFDYLASHVIHIPFESSLHATNLWLKKSEKKKAIHNGPEYQLLYTLNGNIVYRANHGFIYYDNKKVKITHSNFLYMNPENDACTHLLLYLDQPLITNDEEELTRQKPNDSSFKEMIKKKIPKNGNGIAAKIDKLVSKFCDASVNCDSLKLLHDCMENVLNDGYTLIENLDMTNIDSDLIFGSFESYIMESTYDVVFFKITQLLLDDDKKLTLALDDMEHLDFSQIGLPPSTTNERNRVHAAIAEFERIGSFRTPAEKLDCLLNTVSDLTSTTGITFLDSDSLIPLLLITLIRSKVPHLLANLVYMKEYTFERNIVTGKYGYALSTFEGVLDYILESHSDLSKISKQNVQYWSVIEAGDMEQVTSIDLHDLRDAQGNSLLMRACIYNQPKVVDYLLKFGTNDTNDAHCTPLMLAIKHANKDSTTETIKILLKDSSVIEYVNRFDKEGNTATLYACGINNLEMLDVLVQTCGVLLDQQINLVTGDTSLHVAFRNACSLEFVKYVLDKCNRSRLMTKNKKQETCWHLCCNKEVLDYMLSLKEENMLIDLIQDTDETGRSPLMAWAAKGRLDLIELVVSKYNVGTNYRFTRVDKHGKTVLHLLAVQLGKGLTCGEKSIDYVIEKFKLLVNVRDWSCGNTPLHLAAETSILASTPHVNTAAVFIKALVRHGAMLNAINIKDEYPINICKIPALMSCLDELYLKVDRVLTPMTKHSMYDFSWYLTRARIEQNNDETEIYYIIKSGQIGKPNTMRVVKRKLQDFVFLRQELLYEIPELFLPTFETLPNPLLVDLRPPPLAWIDLTVVKLQSFMDWLQYHPVLHYHDLVISFIRSSADLQPSLIRDNSFSRRRLMLEKSSDLPNRVMGSKEERYFLSYAQDMMMPLKKAYLNMLMANRRILNIHGELKNEMLMVAQGSVQVKASLLFSPLIIETIHTCANITCDRSYVSPWPQLLKASQIAYEMVDGILLSLQQPFNLLEERNVLRNHIEQQKEVLRKNRSWQTIFSSKERKRHMEQDKLKVIQQMKDLNHLDGQINQSHKLISDELAHYQTVHPRQMIRSIRRLCKSTVEMERHKLTVLQQTLYKWNSPCY